MTTTGTVLDSIIAGVREDMAARREITDLAALEKQAAAAPAPRDARASLTGDGTTVGLIAEVKRSSPSKGSLADITDPAALADTYAQAGAGAISVLTEQRRFGGSLADLDAVRARVDVPVLRKDFTVEEYQVIEARAHGADIVLLIVAALDDTRLAALHRLTQDLGMQALVEIHDEAELERALGLEPTLLGVNARDLRTLEVSHERACRLLEQIPAGPLVVGESAVADVRDVQGYADAGAHAVLVGEALVTSADPARTAADFRSVPLRGTIDSEGTHR